MSRDESEAISVHAGRSRLVPTRTYLGLGPTGSGQGDRRTEGIPGHSGSHDGGCRGETGRIFGRAGVCDLAGVRESAFTRARSPFQVNDWLLAEGDHGLRMYIALSLTAKSARLAGLRWDAGLPVLDLCGRVRAERPVHPGTSRR